MRVQALFFPLNYPDEERRMIMGVLAQEQPPAPVINKLVHLPARKDGKSTMSIAAMYVAAGDVVVIHEGEE